MAKNTPLQFREQKSEFDPLRVSELIESCRAHTASLQEMATATSEALHDFFEYESDEPHLGICIDVVHQLLGEVLKAYPSLGIVSHDADALRRASEIARGCEAQREILLRARHITLATIYVLRGNGFGQTDQTIASLQMLDDGLRIVFEALHAATVDLPTRGKN